MTEKRLSSGTIAYYWAPPTRAKAAGFTGVAEALGTDYGAAKKRCDDVLNPYYKAWLNEDINDALPSKLVVGSFDWMASIYKSSPKYTKMPAETRSSYDRMLRLVSQHKRSPARHLSVLG
jgi:hypothetical protein